MTENRITNAVPPDTLFSESHLKEISQLNHLVEPCDPEILSCVFSPRSPNNSQPFFSLTVPTSYHMTVRCWGKLIGDGNMKPWVTASSGLLQGAMSGFQTFHRPSQDGKDLLRQHICLLLVDMFKKACPGMLRRCWLG